MKSLLAAGCIWAAACGGRPEEPPSAVRGLREIQRAQEALKKTRGYWVKDIASMPGLSAEIAAADARSPSARPYRGVVFQVIQNYQVSEDRYEKYDRGEGVNPDRYAVAALPANAGEAGNLTWVMNEQGTIWSKDTRVGKAPLHFQSNMEELGWTRLAR